jgi:hypothetical protein
MRSVLAILADHDELRLDLPPPLVHAVGAPYRFIAPKWARRNPPHRVRVAKVCSNATNRTQNAWLQAE